MDHSNNKDQMNFRLWKKLLRLKEKQSSKSLPQKKQKEELKPSMLRIWETTSMFKKLRKKQEQTKDQNMKRDNDKKPNSKKPKIINLNSRPKDSQKKREWKTSSRSRWPRNSLKMNAWNRWMHKKEEWENYSIKEISNNYGKKNLLYIVHKENKNGLKDKLMTISNQPKELSSSKRKKDSYKSMLKS